jgi:hypothetical protein
MVGFNNPDNVQSCIGWMTCHYAIWITIYHITVLSLYFSWHTYLLLPLFVDCVSIRTVRLIVWGWLASYQRFIFINTSFFSDWSHHSMQLMKWNAYLQYNEILNCASVSLLMYYLSLMQSRVHTLCSPKLWKVEVLDYLWKYYRECSQWTFKIFIGISQALSHERRCSHPFMFWFLKIMLCLMKIQVFWDKIPCW